jgi:hypothetical protein
MVDTDSEHTSSQTEREASTYFDPKRLLRICSTCDAISNFSFVMAVLVFIYGIWLLIQRISSMWYVSLGSGVSEAAPIVLLVGFIVLLCLFFWIFLRAISEGLFLLMDIQDNTSPNHE